MTGSSVVRTTLLAIATALGIFFLSYCCMSAPVGDYAVVSLATLLEISLPSSSVIAGCCKRASPTTATARR